MAFKSVAFVVLMMSMVLSTYASYATTYTTSCGKKEDKICEKRDKSLCRYKNFQDQCPRKCGSCAPFTGVCPSSYVFGCCWNGNEALQADKSDCPICEDLNERICNRVKDDCDLAPNTPLTRKLCPRACGACHDYGN